MEALSTGMGMASISPDDRRFYPVPGTKSSHLRVSFSEISKEDAELGISRLAETIRQKRDKLRADKSAR